MINTLRSIIVTELLMLVMRICPTSPEKVILLRSLEAFFMVSRIAANKDLERRKKRKADREYFASNQ